MKYELTLILPGKTTAAKKKAVVEKISNLIETFGGKVGKIEDWGVRDLAYQIKKNTSGIFLFFPLELETKAAKAISDKLRLEEELIRYLLIKRV